MKVAMIGQKGPTPVGGIERHVEALSVRLGAMGHSVIIFTRTWFAPAKARYAKGVTVIASPTVRLKNMDTIVHTFTSTIKAMLADVDVIHYHGVGPSLLSWMPRVFAPRIKVVATFHCIDRKHQKWGPFARMMLGLGERAACLFPHETIAVSKTLESYCENRYNRTARYVPNGVDTQGRKGTDTLAKFGVVKDGYVLMVSRLVRHKGAHYLIRAYMELHKRGLHRGKKLVIVGGSAFTDGYVAELKQLAAGTPDIIFTGYMKGKAMEQMYAGSYAVVHPSEFEGLPITVLEGMSYGKTVLASDIPENMEVVRDHGMYFRNKSVPDLTRKLRALLANAEIARETGKHAKEFVNTNYHWNDVVKETQTIYLSLAPMTRKARVAI